MPRNESDKILNNRVKNIGGVWTDFGTLISKFTKISRINSNLSLPCFITTVQSRVSPAVPCAAMYLYIREIQIRYAFSRNPRHTWHETRSLRAYRNAYREICARERNADIISYIYHVLLPFPLYPEPHGLRGCWLSSAPGICMFTRPIGVLYTYV